MPSIDRTAFEVAAITATFTATVALVGHIYATRRLRERLTEQRLAERKGRIRAEVQLRTLMKRESADSATCGDIEIDAYTYNRLTCIGKVVSPFTKRMGTPRQGALAPHSSGYIQLSVPEQLVDGLDLYSHAWVLFAFHANTDRPDSTKTKIRPPRAPKGLRCGMLATRSPHRPNNIGLSLVRVVRVDLKEKRLYIAALDLVNGTPVYDIKPCVPWDIPGYHNTDSLSVPEWVSQKDAIRKVEFSSHAGSELARLVARGSLAPLYTAAGDGVKDAECTLCEVLAQDPRASNKRGSVQSDPYSLVFGSLAVEFVVGENCVSVLDIKPFGAHIEEAVHVDGIPLLGLRE